MKLEGITYSHEHMVIDLTNGKQDPDCYLNVYEDAMDELHDLYQLGVRRIVDCSNHGMGVDWEVNKKIEEETGIQIINSTGFYKNPFFPPYFEAMTVAEITEKLVDDINMGAKIIGEIGTSKNTMTANERKLFQAACNAQKKTGTVIITHTTLGTYAKEQLEFFLKQDIDLRKVIISHTALANDFDMMVELVKNGANVAFDTIGKLTYLRDATRADFIKKLCEAGYTKQIVLSMDLTRKSHIKKNGGHGYAYLLESFVPMLIAHGVTEEQIYMMLCENFERILKQ